MDVSQPIGGLTTNKKYVFFNNFLLLRMLNLVLTFHSPEYKSEQDFIEKNHKKVKWDSSDNFFKKSC